MIDKYKNGLVSIVADSYDYTRGMEMLAGFADVVKLNGGCLIGRPDSGDPVKCILGDLEIFARAFGVTVQEQGLRVLQNAAIIQGDGISDDMIFDKIYPAVIAARFLPRATLHSGWVSTITSACGRKPSMLTRHAWWGRPVQARDSTRAWRLWSPRTNLATIAPS